MATLLHASCVLIGEKGVLLRGPSGCGKSDLALRLIDQGAKLVTDDQTCLETRGADLIAFAPKNLEGLIEIRHMGLYRLPFVPSATVALIVDLEPLGETLERMPRPAFANLLDRPIQQLTLPSFAASTPAKIRAALLYAVAEDTV